MDGDKTRIDDPIVSHIDQNGRKLVVVRGDLRILGDVEVHGSKLVDVQERLALIEARLNALLEE